MGILLNLFFAFLKIGMFSFGGGYAMLSFIEREIVIKNEWISKSDFIDMVGISQITPGPVAVNSATFVGFKVHGIVGSIMATFGVVFVSFILIIICAKATKKFKDSNILKSAMIGMRPILIALIINAFISLAKTAYVDAKSIIITLIVGVALVSKKINPILVIVMAGVLGIILYR